LATKKSHNYWEVLEWLKLLSLGKSLV
jgi:hypothetical protein